MVGDLLVFFKVPTSLLFFGVLETLSMTFLICWVLVFLVGDLPLGCVYVLLSGAGPGVETSEGGGNIGGFSSGGPVSGGGGAISPGTMGLSGILVLGKEANGLSDVRWAVHGLGGL